jgi:putative transposase
MEIHQAFKFELMPTGEQARKMRQFSGACRHVYNKALALQKQSHEAGDKYIGKFAIGKHLTEWRENPETPWLADAPRHALMMATHACDRAFQNFFAKRTDFPRFKRKGEHDGFQFPDKNQIAVDDENGRIKLPKLGLLRYRKSRRVIGEVRSATVSLRAGKWYVSVLTKREVDQPLPSGPAVGIDMGIARLATLSDGNFVVPLASFKRHERCLAKYQRRMQRKTKFSKNWRKAKSHVQRVHARISNARSDYLHKASTTISKNHALVCVEDLKVRSMSKSAAGTKGAPGKKVAQKRGLNKAILDQGWREFRRQLTYKVAWRGGFIVAVHSAYTSQTCPRCSHVSKENRKAQALFSCVKCGYENNADVVGAINVLAAGQAVFACGGPVQSGRPSKQEPTEVTQAVAA